MPFFGKKSPDDKAKAAAKAGPDPAAGKAAAGTPKNPSASSSGNVATLNLNDVNQTSLAALTPSAKAAALRIDTAAAGDPIAGLNSGPLSPGSAHATPHHEKEKAPLRPGEQHLQNKPAQVGAKGQTKAG
jgi:hypothetical protein